MLIVFLFWTSSVNDGEWLHDPNGFNYNCYVDSSLPRRPLTRHRPIKASTSVAAFVSQTEIRVEWCCLKGRRFLDCLFHFSLTRQFNPEFASLNKNNLLLLSTQLLIWCTILLVTSLRYVGWCVRLILFLLVKYSFIHRCSNGTFLQNHFVLPLLVSLLFSLS